MPDKIGCGGRETVRRGQKSSDRVMDGKLSLSGVRGRANDVVDEKIEHEDDDMDVEDEVIWTSGASATDEMVLASSSMTVSFTQMDGASAECVDRQMPKPGPQSTYALWPGSSGYMSEGVCRWMVIDEELSLTPPSTVRMPVVNDSEKPTKRADITLPAS